MTYPPFFLPPNPCGCPPPAGGDPCIPPCLNPARQSDNLAYNGPDLPCLGIANCDSITKALQMIEEAICAILNAISTTTTTTTATPSTTTTTTTDCTLDGTVETNPIP